MLHVLFSIAGVFQVLPSSRYIGTLLGAVHFTIVVEFIVGTLLGAIHFTIATGYTAGIPANLFARRCGLLINSDPTEAQYN